MSSLAEELMHELTAETAFTIPVFGGIPVAESVVVTWIIMAALMVLVVCAYSLLVYSLTFYLTDPNGIMVLSVAAADLLGSQERWQTLRDEVELLGAGREFDMEAVRAGTLSPVFFGSALTNFGVEPFLEAFLRMTTPPLNRMTDSGEIDAFSPDFSAFVFKIQANMNKAHRDRIAFMRVCSGKFQRESEVFHMQSGKKLRLSQPQQLLASVSGVTSSISEVSRAASDGAVSTNDIAERVTRISMEADRIAEMMQQTASVTVGLKGDTRKFRVV